MAFLAATPQPPSYAVIDTSLRLDDGAAYAEMSTRIRELLARQPGFLGIQSVRDSIGITVPYW